MNADEDLEALMASPIRPYVEQRLTQVEARLAVELCQQYREAAAYVASGLAFQAREDGRLQDEITWRRIATCLFNFSMMELPAQEKAN
jgi:hypothetical protein